MLLPRGSGYGVALAQVWPIAHRSHGLARDDIVRGCASKRIHGDRVD